METKKVTFILVQIALVLLIFLIGFYAINQFLKFYFTAELLRKPCDMCVKANPEVSSCMTEKFQYLPEGKKLKTIKFNITDINSIGLGTPSP